ncbi:hypothetical protein BC940DRAFT_267361 [Gongronella butleri]|nr:hypothetical protein BC940DRAFT_267361 [Gongronella butleri]
MMLLLPPPLTPCFLFLPSLSHFSYSSWQIFIFFFFYLVRKDLVLRSPPFFAPFPSVHTTPWRKKKRAIYIPPKKLHIYSIRDLIQKVSIEKQLGVLFIGGKRQGRRLGKIRRPRERLRRALRVGAERE